MFVPSRFGHLRRKIRSENRKLSRTLCAGIDQSINCLRADQSQNPGEAGNVSLRHCIQTDSGAEPKATGGSSPECKEAMVKVDPSVLSSAEV